MIRYTKKAVRYGVYLASLSVLGVIGWFGAHDQTGGNYTLGGVVDHAEADDVGCVASTGDGSSGDGSSGSGDGGGDGSGGDGSGCSSGCSSG